MSWAGGLVVLLLTGLEAGSVQAGLLLADGGKTSYSIVISHDHASPSEKFAAGELAHFLKQITRADFPVLTDDQASGGPHIFVGDSAALRKVLPNLDLAGLGREGYVVKTVGPHLVLAGGRQRGSMYAVYDLLEDHLGCRWFTPDCSYIPERKRLEVGALNERVIPPLEYRDDDYAEAYDGLWAVRNRLNGFTHRITPEMGDKVHYVGFVHTFYALVPPEKYFRDHPEYFSEINGRRTAHQAQLCLTNPEVVRVATETVREWLRDAKARGLPDDVIVSVSQNDWWGWCECPKCKALAEAEGSQSGPILHFVNQIADNIKDEFPHATIDTLAYSYSRQPPQHVRPRPNVVVRVCSIECCFSHPLASCPENASFMEDLRGWQKVCKRLYVWDYVTDFPHYILPFPNFRVLAPNLRTFVAHKVRGVFEEGNYHGGGEFCQLRAYVLAKLLWNPQYDPERAINEFLGAYYGPAAPFLRQYLDLLHDTVEREQIHVHIWAAPTSPYLRDEILRRAEELFDRAEQAAAGNEQVLLRVRHARMPIMYARLSRFSPRYRLLGDEFVPTNTSGYSELVRQFGELARRLGINHISEGRSMSGWLASLPSELPRLPVVRLQSNDLRAEIIPAAGGRLFRLFDRCLYRNFVHAPAPDSPDYPGKGPGGYVDFAGDTWPGPGIESPWQLVEQSPYHCVLQWEGEGLRVERRLELDTRAPVIRIRVQATNLSSQPRETLLRLHPAFCLGQVDDCMVWFPTVGGKSAELHLAQIPGTEKDIFLDGAEMPKGWWVAENLSHHVGLRATFRPEQVSRCLLNFNRPQGRINLELYSQRRVLNPGESMSVSYQWEILRNTAYERAGVGARGYGRWQAE
jgi:hypothetical protein